MTSRFPDVAFEFVRTFARFEDALKRIGYLKNRPIAEADWGAFARDLDESFFDEVRQAPQAATFVNRPPKALDNTLSWIDAHPVADVATLFSALRRARNNLYHGNKFIGDPSGDDRAKQLLIESLWVLNHAVSKHEKLRQTISQ